MVVVWTFLEVSPVSAAVIHKAALRAPIVAVNARLTMTVTANDTERKHLNAALILGGRRPCHDFTPRRVGDGQMFRNTVVEIGAMLNVRTSSHLSSMQLVPRRSGLCHPHGCCCCQAASVAEHADPPLITEGRIPVAFITCCGARVRRK